MTRSIIETRDSNNIMYYSVIDTMFNTVIIYTTSEKLAKYISASANVCEHKTPYDYMQHIDAANSTQLD